MTSQAELTQSGLLHGADAEPTASIDVMPPVPVLTTRGERATEAESHRPRAAATIQELGSDPGRSDLRVAVHEAGHLAAAYLLHVPRGEVSIIEDVWCAGHTDAGRTFAAGEIDGVFTRSIGGLPIPARVRHRVETEVMGTMAGYMAVVAAEGVWAMYPSSLGSESGEWTSDARTKYLEAIESGVPEPTTDPVYERKLLRRLSGGQAEADAYRTWLMAKTSTLVEMNFQFRRIVEAVVPELIKFRVLSKHQCEAAIRRAFELKPPSGMELP